MCGGSRNRPSTKAEEEVVSPGEIHTPNVTGRNEKGGKRLRRGGACRFQRVEGRRLRDRAAEVLISEGINNRTGEGDGTPLQYSCLENPMDGGAW